jgi:hypothetical protein
MTNNTENLVLEMLKGLRNEVATLRAEMHDEFGDLKQRMLTIERGIVGIRKPALPERPRSTLECGYPF